jgi:hypothetical protein
MSQLQINYQSSEAPWGVTAIHADYGHYEYPHLFILGHADVTTNEIGMLIVQRGAACVTTLRLFKTKLVPFHPIPPQTGLIGVRLLERNDRKTLTFQADANESLTVTIQPDAVVIAADSGQGVRVLHRTPLINVSVIQTEAEIVPRPRVGCSMCASRDPSAVRRLAVATAS